jgi:hypothetical protein
MKEENNLALFIKKYHQDIKQEIKDVLANKSERIRV